MDGLKIVTPVRAIDLGIDVRPADKFIVVVNPDSGELEPPAHGFPSIEHAQAFIAAHASDHWQSWSDLKSDQFIAAHAPDRVTVEGCEGEDIASLRRSILGPDSVPAVH